ncbi:hypothetical protein KJ940_22800 [Myxococcota bacterium]|nr:hypothetical protein [Myxococcota bacterium]
MKNKPKIVRVNRTEFELDDGRVYEHPVPLDYDPTIEDFQRIYNHWKGVIEQYVEEADRQTDRAE